MWDHVIVCSCFDSTKNQDKTPTQKSYRHMTPRELRHNEMRIAEMNSERQSSEYRARTTRLAKWRKLATRANEELQVSESYPERLTSFSCISGDHLF